MNTQRLTEVEIAGRKLMVPTYKDSVSTQRIAASISAQIIQIEKTSPRIDTHAFALQAAYALATQLAAAKDAENDDQKELLITLDDITQTLQKLQQQFYTEPEPSPPDNLTPFNKEIS